MKKSVIAIQSCVITTIVYALLCPVFFEPGSNVFYLSPSLQPAC